MRLTVPPAMFAGLTELTLRVPAVAGGRLMVTDVVVVVLANLKL
jgi:hypothetical protein